MVWNPPAAGDLRHLVVTNVVLEEGLVSVLHYPYSRSASAFCQGFVHIFRLLPIDTLWTRPYNGPMPTESVLLGGDGGDSNSPFGHEEWRPVVGFEGIYDVSDQGHVRRHYRSRALKGGVRFLAVRYSRRRYGQIHLMRDGKTTDRYIHCLVAEAFIGPRPEKHDVNHLDGNRRHNARTNLEYCTRSENIRHAVALGLIKLKAFCIRGHALIEGNLYARANGSRRCRACALADQAKIRARKAVPA